MRVPLYGIDQWYRLFTPRQLLALGVVAKHTRGAREALLGAGYSDEWSDAVAAYLGLMLERLANQGSTLNLRELAKDVVLRLAGWNDKILKLAIGLELKFALRVELGGAARPSSELLVKINEILRGIRSDLELR